MSRITLITIMVCIGFFTGCGVDMPPSESEMKAMPVVKMGSSSPLPDKYVLYLPKGQSFPVEISLKGYLLKSPVKQKVMISLDRDVYLYKYWMSYDGKSWKSFRQYAGMALSAGMDNHKGTFALTITKP